jgi:hypothetical protein
LSQQWKESIIIPIHKMVTKLAVVIAKWYQCYQLYTKLYPVLSQG